MMVNCLICVTMQMIQFSIYQIFGIGKTYIQRKRIKYQTRFFLVNSIQKNVTEVQTGNIATVQPVGSRKRWQGKFFNDKSFGRIDIYYYDKISQEDSTTVVFLDCTQQIITNAQG